MSFQKGGQRDFFDQALGEISRQVIKGKSRDQIVHNLVEKGFADDVANHLADKGIQMANFEREQRANRNRRFRNSLIAFSGVLILLNIYSSFVSKSVRGLWGIALIAIAIFAIFRPGPSRIPARAEGIIVWLFVVGIVMLLIGALDGIVYLFK